MRIQSICIIGQWEHVLGEAIRGAACFDLYLAKTAADGCRGHARNIAPGAIVGDGIAR